MSTRDDTAGAPAPSPYGHHREPRFREICERAAGWLTAAAAPTSIDHYSLEKLHQAQEVLPELIAHVRETTGEPSGRPWDGGGIAAPRLPSFEEIRYDAYGQLGDVVDTLKSDWRKAAGPAARAQLDALQEARDHIGRAKAALNRAAG